MTTGLLALWSSVIPNLPLALPHAGLISAATCGLLALCAAALWRERERPTRVLGPKPAHFGDEERLAA